MSEIPFLRFEPEALHDRKLQGRIPERFATLVFLAQGMARLPDQDMPLEAPALIYWPRGHQHELVVQAGARAILFGLGEELVAEAVGARAQSVYLRLLADTPFASRLPQEDGRIRPLVDWMVAEIAQSDARATMSIAAILRMILITVLRNRPVDTPDDTNEHTQLLRHFRHLVELHHRDHWQMPEYAAKLGISYDRLHRICTRELGRSPTDLVQDRLVAEAKARLERSGAPIKTIAADLGFPDSSRFSHFFKRRTALSPAAYRMKRAEAAPDSISGTAGFADWP